MIKKLSYSLLVILSISTCGFSNSEVKPSVGVVNFSTCMTDSKLGKQEQTSFESLKTQLTSLIEDTEKKLNELATKFNDVEYMDGLSPEAEEEMKNKFRGLSEEMNRYQNQYYQVLQQANMKMMQTLSASIQEASEKVAKDKKLSMVMSKEACFFTAPALDVTPSIITEMDLAFEQKNSKNPISTEINSNPTPATNTANAKVKKK